MDNDLKFGAVEEEKPKKSKKVNKLVKVQKGAITVFRKGDELKQALTDGWEEVK